MINLDEPECGGTDPISNTVNDSKLNALFTVVHITQFVPTVVHYQTLILRDLVQNVDLSLNGFVAPWNVQRNLFLLDTHSVTSENGFAKWRFSKKNLLI